MSKLAEINAMPLKELSALVAKLKNIAPAAVVDGKEVLLHEDNARIFDLSCECDFSVTQTFDGAKVSRRLTSFVVLEAYDHSLLHDKKAKATRIATLKLIALMAEQAA